jgi:hypothetical protein
MSVWGWIGVGVGVALAVYAALVLTLLAPRENEWRVREGLV